VVAHHHHQEVVLFAIAQPGTGERCYFAVPFRELALEEIGERPGIVEREEFPDWVAPGDALKHLAALRDVKVLDLLRGHSPAEAGGNDGAGAGAGKEVEVVAENEGFGFLGVLFCVVAAQ
jgi:hypothetical protein